MQSVSGIVAPDNVSITLTSGYKIQAFGYKEIKMTYGTRAQIAANWPGWQLCDGTNGTPNLEKSFVVGVAAAADPAVVTGNDYVGPHEHNLICKNNTDPRLQTTSDGPGATDGTYIESAGAAVFYALCFITKV